MYKLSYYRFGQMKMDYQSPAGFDRTRNAVIGNKDISLTYLEEAYTTEHWLVRIYRVKKPDEFNRPRIPYSQRKVKTRSSKFLSKKVCKFVFSPTAAAALILKLQLQTSKRKKGTIKHKPTVVKGQKKQKK